MSCVKVTRANGGETSFSEAVCDVFDHDVLTVTCTDLDYDRKFGPLQVYKPHEWIEVTVYDERGNPLFGHLSDLGKQQQVAQQQRRAS